MIALSRLTPGMVRGTGAAFSKSGLEEINFLYFTVYIIDFSCDIIHMCTDKVHTVFLGISHLISFDGFNNGIFFRFEALKKFRCDFFMVNRMFQTVQADSQ